MTSQSVHGNEQLHARTFKNRDVVWAAQYLNRDDARLGKPQ